MKGSILKNLYLKHSLYSGSYLASIILQIPATHFEKTTFLGGPKYMEDPVEDG